MSQLNPLAQPFHPSPKGQGQFRFRPETKPFELPSPISEQQQEKLSQPELLLGTTGETHDSLPHEEKVNRKALPAYAIPFYSQMFPVPSPPMEPFMFDYTSYLCCPNPPLDMMATLMPMPMPMQVPMPMPMLFDYEIQMPMQMQMQMPMEMPTEIPLPMPFGYERPQVMPALGGFGGMGWW